MKSKYIIVEGSEGVGKSTISKSLARRIGCEWTFEPFFDFDQTSTPIYSDLRRACKSKDPMMTKMSRELMLLASRSMSIEHIAKPVLRSGKTLISDRSFISGMVYAYLEGVSFEDWINLFNASGVYNDVLECFLAARTSCIVWVQSKTNKPIGGADDRYDSRGPEFFNKIEETFDSAFRYLYSNSYIAPVIKLIRFENNMNESVEFNTERLGSELERIGA